MYEATGRGSNCLVERFKEIGCVVLMLVVLTLCAVIVKGSGLVRAGSDLDGVAGRVC